MLRCARCIVVAGSACGSVRAGGHHNPIIVVVVIMAAGRWWSCWCGCLQNHSRRRCWRSADGRNGRRGRCRRCRRNARGRCRSCGCCSTAHGRCASKLPLGPQRQRVDCRARGGQRFARGTRSGCRRVGSSSSCWRRGATGVPSRCRAINSGCSRCRLVMRQLQQCIDEHGNVCSQALVCGRAVVLAPAGARSCRLFAGGSGRNAGLAGGGCRRSSRGSSISLDQMRDKRGVLQGNRRTERAGDAVEDLLQQAKRSSKQAT